MDLDSLWDNFLQKIETQLASCQFDMWLKNTKLIELKDDTAKVLVQSEIYKVQIQNHWNNLIEQVFSEISGSNFKFEYVTKDQIANITLSSAKDTSIPMENISYETNLDPKYSFDNFVAGDTNKFAKAIALSVAQKPGEMYNPLYIYGNSGLGKTHLMHAIGNYITQNSSKKVLYVTSEKFVDDFMQLYKKKKENSDQAFNDDVSLFKKKYRNIDVLIIDDVQYLEVVGGIQQEFFNTFNELHQNNKQIILASDRSPDDLKKLEERIRTRFNWGILVDILPPDFDVRMEIIDKKIENNTLNVVFPTDVKEYIASNCTSDVRKLEGAITRVFAYAAIMNGSDITYELAVEALKDYFAKSIISKNKIDLLQQIVAEMYNISVEDLRGKKRNVEISVPRQIAMYICRTYINESYPKIGSEFGGKDHTTVMHSVNKIEKEIKINKKLEEEINKIVNRMNVEKR